MNFKEYNQNMTKLQVLITLVIFLSFCITGVTYAYFAISASDNNTITGNAATVNLTLNVTKIFPTSANTNTGVMVPQLSNSGSENSPLSSALKNGCVDGNKNVVCQVYQITIENKGGTATQVVDGTVLFYGNTAQTTPATNIMPNLKWKLITSADATNPSQSALGANTDLSANTNETTGKFASNLTLTTNAKKEYYMIIWINETNADQSDASSSATPNNPKTFYGLVKFDSSNGTGVTSTFKA